MLGIKCENAKELAQRLQETLKSSNKKYTIRPFNRFDVEKSLWWLVPSTVFPAYKFGKYMVDENKDGTVSVGVHIEKGLEKAINYKKNLMLDDDWVWYEFIEAIEQGNVDNMLQHIYQSVKDNVQIDIVVDVPEAKEQLYFVLQNGHWINRDTEEIVLLKTIPTWIRNFHEIEWFWVDFYITFTFKKLSEQSEQDEMSDFEIVRDLLEPFEQWIK